MGLSVADRGSNDPLFDKPFIDVDEWRVTSQREGRPDALYGRIHNIARVRVVVHPKAP
jgi:hypothetical protein